jgi:hypothetical protein
MRVCSKNVSLRRSNLELAKFEHNTESMAVRIPHNGVIRFFAVHARNNEKYSFWWNNGILPEMLRMDNNYPNNISIQVLYNPHIIEEEILATKPLK